MRRTILTIVICTIVMVSTNAQQKSIDLAKYGGTTDYFSSIASKNQYQFNEEKYLKFKKMRNAGIGLTCVGATLTTIGVILIQDVTQEQYILDGSTGTDDDRRFAKAFGGVMGIATGIVSVGGGITMWVIGNHKMRKYNNSITLKPTKSGVGLAYQF